MSKTIDVTMDNFEESFIYDAFSVACSSCRFYVHDSDTGSWDCFANSDPLSSKCPFGTDLEVRFEECLERFGKDLYESMDGACE